MRILYFYQYFTVPQGSYSTRAYEFARRWAKAGDAVTIVTSVYDKSGLKPTGLFSRFDVEGIDVRMINIRLSNKHGLLFRLLTFAAYALVASWYALTLPADVVVASSGPLTVGLPGLLARYLRRLPLVFEVRDLWPEGAVQLGILRHGAAIRAARWFEHRCYRGASKVVALSEGMADWIERRYGLGGIEVVPNASDNELVESLDGQGQLPEWARGRRLVLYTGTLGLIDDCRQILDAARVVQERGADEVEFVVIGDGAERAALERRSQDLALRNVRFLGLRPKPEVMRWLKAADCALLTVKDTPFLSTASPNKVFDAFAAGAPIVQVTQGWIKDLVERERCGLNVPIRNPEALARAVLRLTSDEELRKTLGANARRLARQQFDRSLLARKMRGIIAEAARAKL